MRVRLETSRLANGLEVLAVEHRRAPIVAIAVLYHVGSQDELPSQAGLAHVVEHLAFGTSAYLAREEFDQYCTDAGGTNNAMTTYSYTLYHMVVPAYQLPLGLWLEASRLRGLLFTDEEFATQQSVILEELNETVYNQPYGQWRDVQAQQGFAPECSYHWEVHGVPESVAALTPNDARAFVRHYYRPDNAVLVICGDVEADYALELAQEAFAEIEACREPIPRPEWRESCRRSGVRAVVEDAVPLPAVFLSFHCGGYSASGFLHQQALAEVLGGGRSSRLYRRLLLGGVAAETSAFLDAREWSSLLTCYGVAAGPEVSAEQLEEALWQTLHELIAQGIAESELEKVRHRLMTASAVLLQSPLGIAEEVALGAMFWGDPERPFRILDEYARITVEELTEVGRSIFRPDNAVTTIVLPRA
ncbi:MAG: insulinase family protein [Candidatus Kapabacteria bacterium]|nr:insulinase family protein [Candidatus Kapabacteria bacterium]MDW8011903.1 pitrilysin family protein [Bacteroidota bacterium]